MPISLDNFKNFCNMNPAQPQVGTGILLAPSDDVLQLCLDSAQEKCLAITGQTQAPSSNTFELAVYRLAKYYLRQNEPEKRMTENTLVYKIKDQISTPGFNRDIHQAFMRMLVGLLASDRDVSAFMPEVSSDAS